jgi:hypothetical protein
LRHVAAFAGQKVVLVLRFHTFGDDMQSEAVRHAITRRFDGCMLDARMLTLIYERWMSGKPPFPLFHSARFSSPCSAPWMTHTGLGVAAVSLFDTHAAGD